MADLQTTFRSFLPKYMWPTHIERLSALPLTPNGKLDRRALPKPDFAAVRSVSKAVRVAETASEKAVALIWQELLHVKDVGLDDNFFDLGGHSLLTLKMLARINETFGKNLKLRDVLTATLGQLASLIASEERV
ncbi:MAG: hypothetical protein EOP07_19960 [Proteobacteria bacterium]|nr:MAG: hypothetical protein EOP07_19960 [Pseudomonadota bacterium]